MFAAELADTATYEKDAWRLVRYLLEKANADIIFTGPDDKDLTGIIRSIRNKAKANNVIMPPDFIAVVAWLKKHGIETTPVLEKKLPTAITK